MKRHQLVSRVNPDEWARPRVHAGGVGGYSEKAMKAAHEAAIGQQPMTVRCGTCGRYKFTGPAAVAVVRLHAHLARRHPELVRFRKGKRRRERERAMELARRRGSDAGKRAAA